MISAVRKHFHIHSFKYLSFFIIAALVALLANKVFEVKADAVPGFQGYVGTPVSLPAGDHQAPINYVTQVVFDDEGNMYTGANTKIQKYDANGNYVLSMGSGGTGNGQFCYVEGIAVHTFGSTTKVLASDSCNGRVEMFDASDGSYLSQFAFAASGYQYPTGIAVKSNGTIYVADCGSYNTIRKYDSSGVYLSTVAPSGSSDGQTNCPYYMEFDSQDNLYAADGSNARVQRFDSSDVFSLKITNGSFSFPMGAGADASGNIYIADSQTVYKYNSSGVLLSTLGGNGEGSANNQFAYVQDVTISASGDIYVADTSNYRVMKFDAAGNYLTKWVAGMPGSGNGEFNTPQGVASDADGNIYVVDKGNNRVQKFDSNGNFLLKWGTGGSGDGQFSYPYGIAIDASSSVYIADEGNQRIQKFDSSGNFITKWGQVGSGNGDFGNYYGQSVHGLATDSSNNVYEVDIGRFNSQKFNANGGHLLTFGTCCSGNSFFVSDGLDVDSSGMIYIADTNAGAIKKFSTNGVYDSQFNAAGSGSLYYPKDVEFDSQGNLYVANNGSASVIKYDSNLNYLLEFGQSGDLANRLVTVTNITTLPDGRVVVVDPYANRVSIYGTPPLTISSLSATSTTSTTIVTWTTDDLGTTQVEFGPTTTYGSTTSITNTSPKVTSHSVTLSGLASCALYNYRVKSAHASATTTSANYTFVTDSCTGMASSTATTASTASTTATSTITLSTITVAIPPTFSTTTTATTTFQAVKLEPQAFFASSSLPVGTQSASNEVFHLTALTSATTTLSTFTAPISVTLSYDPATMSSTINVATLKIYRYDDGAWNALSNCTRDTTAHTVTCETSHFSDFALFGDPNTSVQILGGSYFVNTGGSAAGTTGGSASVSTTTAQATTTPVPTPKPVPTPTPTLPKATTTVKVAPKPVSKPVVATSTKTVTKATTTPKAVPGAPVLPPPAPVAVVPSVPAYVEVPTKKTLNFLDILSLKVYGGVQEMLCLWGKCR